MFPVPVCAIAATPAQTKMHANTTLDLVLILGNSIANALGDYKDFCGIVLQKPCRVIQRTNMRVQRWVLALFLPALISLADELPRAYFQLLHSGTVRIEARLNSQPGADLKTLEMDPGWRHFPYAILAPAVLYAKQHHQNPSYHDPHMLELAIRIGDMLAAENEKGTFEPRLDSDWDT